MFIESITVSGIFKVLDEKTHNFNHPNRNEDNNNNGINTIGEMEYVFGFSLIFDKTFDENYDLTKFIYHESRKEPFVEIELSQRENIAFHNWFGTDELKLKRKLREPQFIFVGKTKVKVKKFHETIENMGFLNFDNIFIHRLLANEIPKLSYFVGDDLWQMLKNITACEQLIEITEQQQGSFRKREMKRTYERLSDQVCNLLPKRVKLRDQIHTQLVLQNRLYTFIKIIGDRQSVILNHQMTSNEEKIAPFLTQLKEYFSEDRQVQKSLALTNTRKENSRNLCTKIDENYWENEKMISTLMLKNHKHASPTIEEFIETTDELMRLNQHGLQEYRQLEDIGSDYDLTAWKLYLKKNEESQHDLNSLIEVAKEIEAIKKEEAEKVDKEIEDCLFKASSLNIGELEAKQKRYQTVDIKQLTHKLTNDKLEAESKIEVAEILESACKKAFEASIPSSYRKAVIIIEDMLKINQDIAVDYIGPVYKFLDPTKYESMHNHVWQQIQEEAQTILMKTGKSARNLSVLIYKYKVNFQGEIIGIDEYQKYNNSLEILKQNQMKFFYAKSLIYSKIAPDLKSVISHLLHTSILIEDENIEYVKDLEDWDVTVYGDVVSKTYQKESISVVSQLPKEQEVSSIKSALEMQANIKKRNIIMQKNAENKATCGVLKGELSAEKASNEKELLKLKKNLLYEKSRALMLMQEKSYLTPRTNLLDRLENLTVSLETDMENWDEAELEEELDNYEFTANPTISHDDLQIISPIELMHTFVDNFDNENLYDDVSKTSRDANEESTKKKLNLLKNYRGDLKQQHLSATAQIIELSYEPAIPGKENLIEKLEVCNEFGKLYAKKGVTENTIAMLNTKINETDENQLIHFHQQTYDEYQNRPCEEIIPELVNTRDQLMEETEDAVLRLAHITRSSYVKLVDSIRKVRKYAEEKELFVPVQIKMRAFPFMNAVVVKILRDTVYNFKTTYNLVFSDFLVQSSLFFYTHGNITEAIEDDNFTWNCFDMTRIKAIDFDSKWKNRSDISIEKIKQIKVFLLILHIINYISIFKFLFISSKIFDEMNPSLEEKLRSFLKAVSSFIQVIIINESNQQEEQQEGEEEEEPMNISA